MKPNRILNTGSDITLTIIIGTETTVTIEALGTDVSREDTNHQIHSYCAEVVVRYSSIGFLITNLPMLCHPNGKPYYLLPVCKQI